MIWLCFGGLLALTLAACGNTPPNDDESTDAPIENHEDLTNEADIDEDDAEVAEEDSEEQVGQSYTLALHEDDFIKKYSEYVDTYDLGMKMPDSIPTNHGNGFISTEVFLALESSVYTSATPEGELVYVLLDSYKLESRQNIFNAIKAMILAVNNDFTEDEAAEIMADLGLTDAEDTGEEREVFETVDQFSYLLDVASNGSVEFGIIHKDDPELAPED